VGGQCALIWQCSKSSDLEEFAGEPRRGVALLLPSSMGTEDPQDWLFPPPRGAA